MGATLNMKTSVHRLLALTLAAILPLSAVAGPRDQAKRLHDRIAGVPPSAAVLDQMEALISGGDTMAAADVAMENSAFYNVTLKNFVTPWTNEEQTVFAPLNDYTATVIGMIRDEVPFNQVLSADLLYVGQGSFPAYATNNNNHYEAIETQGADLKTVLRPAAQSTVTGLPAEATAGVMTTRAAAEAFFSAGTNRAMLRFTLMNHLCNDLEQLMDTTLPPDRIRQDVSRSPGGDSRVFLNSCMGCHTGMDPLAQAFAYYDFDLGAGRILYNGAGTIDPVTGTRVQPKYLINGDNFRHGYVTTDDGWDNYWRSGSNTALGWDPGRDGRGAGAKSLGIELANSEAFASCQVKKTFRAMCLRPPGDAADHARVDAITAAFRSGNYNMKRVFAETAVYCMGD